MSWWRRLVKGEVRTASAPSWAAEVGDVAHDVMDWPVTDDFHAKQGRSTGRILRGSLRFYLKRHWRLPWRLRLMSTLIPERNWSPGATEWAHLCWARDEGFPVPEPLAYGEFLGPWLQLRSYLVVRELTGQSPLHEAVPRAFALMRPRQFQRWKSELVRTVADLTRRLHQYKRFHKDLYLCHYYVATPQSHHLTPGPLHLIDFHRLGHHPWLNRRWRIKDLAQLLFSTWSVDGITNQDRLQFLRAYLGASYFGDLDRALVRAVVNKAQRYAQHNGVTPREGRMNRGKAA